MRPSRSTITWMTLFALVVIAVVIITQGRDGNTRSADHADGAQFPIDGAHTHEQPPAVTPPSNRRDSAATWAAISRELTRDSSDANCVRLVKEAAAFAEGERSTAAPRDTEAHDEWLMAELDKLQRSAANLRYPVDILAALLLRSPQERKWDDPSTQTLLLEFGTRAASSDHSTAAWHALRLCAEAGTDCPFSHLENELLDVQLANAEAWALVATSRYQRRDVSGALAAMQRAARSVGSTWYWTETIDLVERGLATNTSITFPDSAGIAFGSAAVAIPAQSGLLTMCRVESTASRAWADACLAFGTLRQETIETQLGQETAYTLRRQALAALGDQEGAAEVAAEYERFTAERMAGGLELVAAAAGMQAALINADRARMHAYLDTVGHRGETVGLRNFFQLEAPALMERAGLLGQEGVQECVAELFLEPLAAGTTRRAIAEHRLEAGDELHMTLRDSNRSMNLTRRVGPDGKVMLSRGLSVTAAGMTTEQFQRELAAAISNGGQPPEALVIPIPRRPRDELRSGFDSARSQVREGYEGPR